MTEQSITISVEVDGIGKDFFTGIGLTRHEALSRFCKKHSITDIDSLRHQPRVRLEDETSSKSKDQKPTARKNRRRAKKKS